MERGQQKKEQLEVRLDVLVLKGDGVLVAQCLQHDIAVQAATDGLLRERFVRAVQLRLAEDEEKGRTPLSTVPQAPRRFWDMYLRGDLVVDPRDVPIFVPSSRDVPAVDVRARFAQAPQVEARA
jgi:hypothetical protein